MPYKLIFRPSRRVGDSGRRRGVNGLRAVSGVPLWEKSKRGRAAARDREGDGEGQALFSLPSGERGTPHAGDKILSVGLPGAFSLSYSLSSTGANVGTDTLQPGGSSAKTSVSVLSLRAWDDT